MQFKLDVWKDIIQKNTLLFVMIRPFQVSPLLKVLVTQTYKILHQLAPTYLHNIFEYAVNVTGHASRNLHRLFVPWLRTNYGKCSLYYQGTVLWNALPAALCGKTIVTQFRSSYLETYLET